MGPFSQWPKKSTNNLSHQNGAARCLPDDLIHPQPPLWLWSPAQAASAASSVAGGSGGTGVCVVSPSGMTEVNRLEIPELR